MRRSVVWAAVLSPVLAVGAVITLAVVSVFNGVDGTQSVPTGGALRDGTGVPPEYVPMIRDAVSTAGCPELTESVLAAQLNQESGFNPKARSTAGAVGIAQFLPSTWKSQGRDENGDGVASPFDPEDAIPAAARFDCALVKSFAGIPGDPVDLMLAGYNAGPGAVQDYQGVPPYPETRNYVRSIRAKAAEWAASPVLRDVDDVDPEAGVVLTGNKFVDAAVSWAAGQIGSIYHFGGDCTDPFGPDLATHCDCSSLVQQAYAHAGIPLPRTAHEQARQGVAVPIERVVPGDLVVTVGEDGTVAEPGHIGIYAGAGNVIEAPFEGRPVHFFPLSGYHDIVTIRRIVS